MKISEDKLIVISILCIFFGLTILTILGVLITGVLMIINGIKTGIELQVFAGYSLFMLSIFALFLTGCAIALLKNSKPSNL